MNEVTAAEWKPGIAMRSLLVVLLVGSALFSATGQSAELVALTEQAAPDTELNFEEFLYPVINNAGQVGFVAVTFEAASPRREVFRWTNDDGTRLLESLLVNPAGGFDTIPNTVVYRDSSATIPRDIAFPIDEDGRLSIIASLVNPTFSFVRDWAVVRADAGADEVLGRYDMVLPDRPGIDWTDNASSSLTRPVLGNTAGDVAFIAFTAGSATPGTLSGSGIFVQGSAGLSTAVHSGDDFTADGSVFSAFDNLALNQGGRVAFTATVTGAGIDTSNDGRVVRQTAGGFEVVAREGDQAPGFGSADYVLNLLAPFQGLQSQSVENLRGLNFNNNGLVAFTADVVDLTGQNQLLRTNNPEVLLFGTNPSDLARAVWVGQDAAFMFDMNLVPFSEAYVYRLGDPLLSDDDEIVFEATASNAGEAIFADGIFRYDTLTDDYQVIAQSRQSIDAGTTLFSFGDVAMNDDGLVAFTSIATVEGTTVGASVLFAERPTGGIEEIARSGDTLSVAPGDDRVIAGISLTGGNRASGHAVGFNTEGTTVFTVDFEDGSSGIFIDTNSFVATTEFVWQGFLGDDDWHTTDGSGSNWADGTTPNLIQTGYAPGDGGPGEMVTIVDADVVVRDRPVDVFSINATGSLTVQQPFSVDFNSRITDLTLSADLRADGDLTLNGAGNVWDTGRIEGAADVLVEGDLLLAPVSEISLDTTLSAVDGKIALEGGTLNLGLSGVLHSEFEGELDLRSGLIVNTGDDPGVIVDGTLRKSGSGSAEIDAVFDGSGVTRALIEAGELLFSDPVTYGAVTTTISDGAILAFDPTILTLQTDDAAELISFDGAGTLQFEGGGLVQVTPGQQVNLEGSLITRAMASAANPLVFAGDGLLNLAVSTDSTRRSLFTGGGEVRFEGRTDLLGAVEVGSGDLHLDGGEADRIIVAGSIAVREGATLHLDSGVLLDGASLSATTGGDIDFTAGSTTRVRNEVTVSGPDNLTLASGTTFELLDQFSATNFAFEIGSAGDETTGVDGSGVVIRGLGAADSTRDVINRGRMKLTNSIVENATLQNGQDNLAEAPFAGLLNTENLVLSDGTLANLEGSTAILAGTTSVSGASHIQNSGQLTLSVVAGADPAANLVIENYGQISASEDLSAVTGTLRMLDNDAVITFSGTEGTPLRWDGMKLDVPRGAQDAQIRLEPGTRLLLQEIESGGRVEEAVRGHYVIDHAQLFTRTDPFNPVQLRPNGFVTNFGTLDLRGRNARLNNLPYVPREFYNVEAQLHLTDIRFESTPRFEYTGDISTRNAIVRAAAFVNLGGEVHLDDAEMDMQGGVFANIGVLSGSGQIIGTLWNAGGGLPESGIEVDNLIDTLVAPGSSPGTLEITGDLIHDSGTLALEIGGAEPGTGYDQIIVGGTAVFNIAEAIELSFIDPDPADGVEELYRPRTGDTFELIVADEWLLPDGMSIEDLIVYGALPRGLRAEWDLVDFGDGFRLQLVTTLGSRLAETAGLTPGMAAVAEALDLASIESDSEALTDFALTLDELPAGPAQQARLRDAGMPLAAAIYGQSLAAFGHITAELTRRLDAVAWDELAMPTGMTGTAMAWGALGVTQGGNAAAADELVGALFHLSAAAGNPAVGRSGWRGFMSAAYNAGELGETTDQLGYDYDGGTATLGLEHRSGSRTFGFGASFAALEGDTPGAGHQGSTDVWAVSGFAQQKFDNGVFVDGLFTYGGAQNDYTRALGNGQSASGESDQDVWSLAGRAGYLFNAGGFRLGPLLALDYVSVDAGDLTESGAGDLSLAVSGGRYEQFGGEISAYAGFQRSDRRSFFAPYLQLGYRFVIDSKVPDLSAGFLGAPGQPFPVYLEALDLEGATLNAGIYLMQSKRLSLSLAYDGLFGKNDTNAHGASAHLNVLF